MWKKYLKISGIRPNKHKKFRVTSGQSNFDRLTRHRENFFLRRLPPHLATAREGGKRNAISVVDGRTKNLAWEFSWTWIMRSISSSMSVGSMALLKFKISLKGMFFRNFPHDDADSSSYRLTWKWILKIRVLLLSFPTFVQWFLCFINIQTFDKHRRGRWTHNKQQQHTCWTLPWLSPSLS